jgi:DNA-binding NarL/FixJ family response regulator
MKEKLSLAVYDEKQLQKELLHHLLERLQFDVYYSTTKLPELKEYFEQRPADILLVNGENQLYKFTAALSALRKRQGKLNVIFYNFEADDWLLDETKGMKGIKVCFTSGGWANLLDKIELCSELKNNPAKKQVKPALISADSYPFPKVVSDKKNVEILRYLKEGKSNRQIAYLLNISIDSIKYRIKKMHDETKSNTTKMVADAIKAGLI